jgi:Cu/Ag efflux protein CusF
MKRLFATLALLVTAHAGIAAPVLTDAEVRKVDKPAARITLKHAEIRSLDMPAMTMAYRVNDPAMLDKVQPGDHVRFAVERVNSQYTIVQLDLVR